MMTRRSNTWQPTSQDHRLAQPGILSGPLFPIFAPGPLFDPFYFDNLIASMHASFAQAVSIRNNKDGSADVVFKDMDGLDDINIKLDQLTNTLSVDARSADGSKRVFRSFTLPGIEVKDARKVTAAIHDGRVGVHLPSDAISIGDATPPALAARTDTYVPDASAAGTQQAKRGLWPFAGRGKQPKPLQVSVHPNSSDNANTMARIEEVSAGDEQKENKSQSWLPLPWTRWSNARGSDSPKSGSEAQQTK
eukprot:CAMPEP_0206047238 /NCGR_PEP_ID=MMETSP1466-20131121/20754_1 /ASSEMBLY_ACC=CAM_ASM_001126 /TAXON_ID=44452 /ORGANISM="Pavlova gyrans, Strain CCMP608" /LENGTH=248 /DNA_ID=CAMNT_0053422249 /DNA_START=11 /DNA_END=757 /DNA_ORIENTATION=+